MHKSAGVFVDDDDLVVAAEARLLHGVDALDLEAVGNDLELCVADEVLLGAEELLFE